jgi:hypothetical protein
MAAPGDFESWYFNDWDTCVWALAMAAEADDLPEAEYYYCVSDCIWNTNMDVEEEYYDDEDYYGEDYDEYMEEDVLYEELLECEEYCYENTDCDADC